MHHESDLIKMSRGNPPKSLLQELTHHLPDRPQGGPESGFQVSCSPKDDDGTGSLSEALTYGSSLCASPSSPVYRVMVR